jgi:hypothetical protein
MGVSVVNFPKVTHPRSRYQGYVLLYCEKGKTAIHSLTEIFAIFPEELGFWLFACRAMEALRNFPHMINLLQGNKNRQRYRVYSSIEKPCERTI